MWEWDVRTGSAKWPASSVTGSSDEELFQPSKMSWLQMRLSWSAAQDAGSPEFDPQSRIISTLVISALGVEAVK